MPGRSRRAPIDRFDTTKQVTITMWDTEDSADRRTAEDALIKQFEQKYPNVTVKRT